MQSKTAKIWISLALTVLVSGGLGYFALKSGPPLVEVKSAISHIGISAIGIALSFVLLQNFFMMVRLWILGRASERGFLRGRAFKAIAIGQFANSVLPARIGDFLKLALMTGTSSNGGVPFATAMGVMAADKLVDTVAFLLMILLTGAVFLPEFWVKVTVPEIGVTGVAIALGGLAFGLFLIRRSSGVIKAKWHELRSGLLSVFHPKCLLPALLMGMLVWTSEALAMGQLGGALGVSLSPSRIFFLFSLLNLAIAIPISIGNLGVFEAAIVAGLGVLSVPTSEAIAIAVMHHLIQVLATLVWGLVAIPFTKVWPHFAEKPNGF